MWIFPKDTTEERHPGQCPYTITEDPHLRICKACNQVSSLLFLHYYFFLSTLSSISDALLSSHYMTSSSLSNPHPTFHNLFVRSPQCRISHLLGKKVWRINLFQVTMKFKTHLLSLYTIHMPPMRAEDQGY